MPVQEFTPEELESEDWRDIPNYEGIYQASSLGRIQRVGCLKRQRRLRIPLKPSLRKKNGYPYVRLCNGKRSTAKTYFVHRLVTAAFLGPRPECHQVNHLDADKTNARISNLEYVTPQQNIAHAMRLGLRRSPAICPNRQGEKSAAAKLTSQNVVAIRRAILDGVTGLAIAKQYGVTAMNISSIKLGKSWGHLVELKDEVKALGSWKTRHIIPRGRNAR